MAKYCQTCGTPNDDRAVACANCRAPFQPMYQPQQPVYQAPPQPTYQQPVYQAPPQPTYQQPVYQAPPQPTYQQPVYQQPAPQPTYQQPVYQQPAPQPTYQQPVYQQPAPQPTYQQPAPQPTYQQPAPQPAYQPAPKAPKTSINSLDDVIALVKKHIKWVMVGIAGLAFIFFILHTFGLFEASFTRTVERTGDSMKEFDGSWPISDLTDIDGLGVLTFLNIFFGIMCLVAVALCAHGFIKNHMRLSFIPFLKDQPGTYAGSTEFTLANMALAGGSLLTILGYFILGSTSNTRTVNYFYGTYTEITRYSVSPHFTLWIILILFAGLVAADIFLLRKKKAGAAPQAPAPEAYAPQASAPEAYAPPAQPTGYQQPPMN